MIGINDTEEEKMYATFKIQQHYQKLEQINNLFLKFISEMLLCGKLQIRDLPYKKEFQRLVDLYVDWNETL